MYNVPFISSFSNLPRRIKKGTGHNKFNLFEEDPPCLGRKVFEDVTFDYLMNMTNKTLLALKFELTLKFSASKS